MNKEILKKILPFIALFVVCIPIATSSILDYQQKRANEIILEKQRAAEKALADAQEKVYLLGKFDPAQNPTFTEVPTKYNISGHTIYLRKETLDDFERMAEAASIDGVELTMASATRNFDYQKNLWNNKWTGATLVDGKDLSKTIPDGLTRFRKILEYSAVPSTSRHHWGTDIDINNANVEYFDTEYGEKVYSWMQNHAKDYGFCQTYTAKDAKRPNGYNEEKWHWSYLPLSRAFTQDYQRLITNADISGFDGDQYVAQDDVINNYVLAINPDCL